MRFGMLLAARALGLGTIWFTLFEKEDIKKILELNPAKDPIALICFGMPSTIPALPPRKDAKERTCYLR